MHLVAATPGPGLIEFPPGELEAPLVADPPRQVDGHVAVSERPGLGADPDPDVLARFPFGDAGRRPFYLR